MRLPDFPRPVLFRSFPLREAVEELKKQKKLDAQTLVYIKQLFASDRGRTFIYWEHGNESKFLGALPEQRIFFRTVYYHGLDGNVKTTYSTLLSSAWHLSEKDTPAFLEEVPDAYNFFYFCYKFADLDKRKGYRKIEYGLLVSAYDLYQKDPAAFGRVIRSARNKKELQGVLGVR